MNCISKRSNDLITGDESFWTKDNFLKRFNYIRRHVIYVTQQKSAIYLQVATTTSIIFTTIKNFKKYRERQREREREREVGFMEEQGKQKKKNKNPLSSSFCPINNLDDGCLMHIFSFLSPIPGLYPFIFHLYFYASLCFYVLCGP